MLCAATLAVIFPSVTSIVGIATGFGSVLWTFIMPVVMIFILRHRACKAKIDGSLRIVLPALEDAKRERLLSSPLASPAWSPRESPLESPLLSPTPSFNDLPPLTLDGSDGSEEMCMQIEEPDSGKKSTVVLVSQSPKLDDKGTVPTEEHPRVMCRHVDHYPWSIHFTTGVLSLAVGSVLGLTAAYQSLQRVLQAHS